MIVLIAFGKFHLLTLPGLKSTEVKGKGVEQKFAEGGYQSRMRILKCDLEKRLKTTINAQYFSLAPNMKKPHWLQEPMRQTFFLKMHLSGVGLAPSANFSPRLTTCAPHWSKLMQVYAHKQKAIQPYLPERAVERDNTIVLLSARSHHFR